MIARRPTTRVMALALALSAAAACTKLPPVTERPAQTLPAAFDPLLSASGPTLANQPWWEVFQDAALQSLIRVALDANTDIRLAAVRVLEARAAVGVTRANQRPGLDATVTAGAQRVPAAGDSKARSGAALAVEGAASWDPDFWGRLRAATESARAQLLAAEWGRRAVMTSLVSDVAATYFSLRARDFELEIARRTLASRQDSLALAQVRERGGATSLLDVRQAEQLVYGATGTIADLERRIALEEHTLNVLLGRSAVDVARGLALSDQPHMPDVPAGLPSDLLAKRPDIEQAEAFVVAADADLAAARAAFFPRIALTGSGGLASAALTSLFTGGAGLFSAAVSVAQPLFDGGRRLSQAELAEARRQGAFIDYEATVRQAFREVQDALISYRKFREFREQQGLLQQAAQDARRLADLRYQGGATSYLEVLDADTRLFSAELGLADARLDELNAFVDLYRSLGGGWQ